MTPCSNSAAALAATASRVRMGRATRRLASSASTLNNSIICPPGSKVSWRFVGGRDGSNGSDGSGIGDSIAGANQSGHSTAMVHRSSSRRRHGFTGIFDTPRMVAGSSSPASMARFSSGGGGGGGTAPAADEEEEDLTEEERQSIFTSLQKEPSLASSQAAERMRVREKHLKEHKFYVAERTKMLGGVNGEVPEEDEEEEETMQELTAPIEPEPLGPKSGMQTGLAAAAGTSQHEGDKSPPTPKKSATGEEKTKKPQKRRRIRDVTIAEVLRAKHTLRWVEPVISRSATVRDAVVVCIEGGLSGMMVIDYSHVPHSPAAADEREEDDDSDDDSIPVTHTNPSAAVVPNEEQQQQHPGRRGRVVGMITSRDLLRIMAAGFQGDMDAESVLSQRVGEFMTPISQVIYARPDETIGMCRTVMAKLGVKCLPILSNGQRVEGLITARDLSEFGLEVTDRGGKKNFLKDVSERVGLSSNTSMAEPPAYLRAHLALEQKPLFVNVGIAELPHPFKTVDGIGMNKRDHGPRDWSTDVDLSEDAHFAVRVTLPDESGVKNRFRDVCYMGVADGVGSWREYGVDPRDFSHRLMEECRNILLEASAGVGIGMNGLDASSGGGGSSGGGAGTTAAVPVVPTVGGGKFRRAIAPAEVLAQAYDRVKGDDVVGSCTACVAMFDGVRHQLHFSNLGDSGIIVLRHIDSDVAGSLKRDRQKKREERESDLRVAFVSQQQLRSFNHPYQLGWVGEELAEGDSVSFKTAADSCTSSVHVRRGDIVILATDGLFDNVDIDDIAEIALQWEQENGFVRGGDVTARAKRWEKDNSMTKLSEQVIPDLAEVLCQTAREKSLDDGTDGPFAILAKENDIMWSGGMPDDCTVVAIHVVGKDPHEVDDVPE